MMTKESAEIPPGDEEREQADHVASVDILAVVRRSDLKQ